MTYLKNLEKLKDHIIEIKNTITKFKYDKKPKS